MTRYWKMAMAAVTMTILAACGAPEGGDVEDATLDDADACGLCSGKADGWQPPEEGSCGALAMLDLVNTASFDELDVDARLNARAAREIVEARGEGEFEDLESLDAVPYVGPSALQAISVYAEQQEFFTACESMGSTSSELQLISDIDKTIMPPDEGAPYPGVSTLYAFIELGSDGSGSFGDTTYVTARQPERVTEVPAYFEEYGLPEGPIETGVSGIPWIAEDEKFRDISGVIAGKSATRYVMFGDSSHRDPEAYRRIIEAHPDLKITGLIHRVTEDEPEERFEGVHVYENYAHAAAILVKLDILTRAEAMVVFEAAVDEGLEMSEEEMEALLP